MAFPSKTRINVGAVTKRPQDLSCQAITSLDFGALSPVFCRTTTPDDTYKVDLASFCRTAPLVVPTFGRVSLHMDTFFVPYFMLWSHWDDFYSENVATDATGFYEQLEDLPYFTMYDLGLFIKDQTFSEPYTIYHGTIRNALIAAGYTTDEEIDSITHNATKLKRFINDYFHPDFIQSIEWDWSDEQDSGEVICYRLNRFGKKALNILRGLGYDLQYNYEYDDGEDDFYKIVVNFDDTKLNALRLIAYFKVLSDWYFPAQFSAQDVLRTILEKIKQQATNVLVNLNDLIPYFTYATRCYDDDLYNTSNVQPQSSIANGSYTDPNIKMIPQAQGVASSYYSSIDGQDGAYVAIGDSEISQPVLSALSKLQEYAKRKDIGGHRAIDRYLSEFGVKSESVRNTRSVLVHSYVSDIQISDVTSTSDTEGASLGSYAGKGIAYEANKYSFDTNDFGVLFTIASVVPTGQIASGIDPNVLDVNLAEQFIPEFDQLGFEALEYRYLKNYDNNSGIHVLGSHASVNPSSVFGFVPRYAHMKVGRNLLSGDFRIPSLNQGMDAWHLYRNLDWQFSNDDVFRMIDTDSTYAPGTPAGGYDRIFDITDTLEDHFYLFCQFNVTALRPMLSLTDEYDLDHPDDGQSHKQVTLDYRGMNL